MNQNSPSSNSSNWYILRLHRLPISFWVDRRVPVVILGLGLCIIATVLISISQGEYAIPILDTAKVILGLETSNPDYVFVVNTLRLPRTITACLVGMALAIAGTITQSITRNPLAAPGIIGVNAGASLAAVSVIILFPSLPVAVLPIAAFGGAAIVAVAIYLLAWDGGTSPVRLVLVGIGFSFVAGALTNLMTTFGNINSVSQALVWLAGSVYGRSWAQVYAMLPWLVVFGLIALLMTRELNNLHLGDDMAIGLGSRLEVHRGLLLLSGLALAGSAVATAGNIGFVGLMAPHLARRLVGASHQSLLPIAALLGCLLVAVADLLARLAFAPIELPCGIITAAVGAPYFVYLLIWSR
ncbi:ABC-type transporter, integral membrane subunit [Thalassoporum mexicanum PCC 7367]|uniref:FecCD family ABC transporter permease n=1 Tax=Thalassoporum mexicanum TaxID=3457544 RepID=UPI00029F8E54|nr:iron ABC transporter permease [Pseudanabaena sp. PCC 7367]AFY71452.1 ABC-type transporter, integral membrane subunit [Pseudanabaena sp. PCC 7367]